MRAPMYKPDQVRTQPLSGARLRPATIDNTVGPALRGAAGQLDQLAEEEARRQDEFDRTAATDLDNQKAARTRARLWGENGLLLKNGKTALESAAEVQKAMEEDDRELMGQAKTQQQRDYFSRVLAARNADNANLISRHLAGAQEQYRDSQENERTAQFKLDAQATYGDPKTQGIALENMRQSIGQTYARKGLAGAGGAIFAAESAVHAGVVTNLMQENRPVAAEEYLNKHLNNLTPEDRRQVVGPVRDAVLNLEADGVGDSIVNGNVAVAIGTEAPTVNGVTQAAGHPVANQIRQASGPQGVDPNAAVVFGMIESSLNPNAKNGDSIGVFAMSTTAWKELGGTDANRNDPVAQVEIGVKRIARDYKVARGALGREPQAWEAYMVHQQGYGGGPALMKAPPETNAAAVLEGIGVSSGRAKASIAGNIPQKYRDQGFTAENTTAGQFVQMWRETYAAKAAQAGVATASSPIATSAAQGEPNLEQSIAMAKVKAAGDPVREKAYIASVRQSYAQREANKADRERIASDAAQPYLHNPAVTTFAQFPANVYAQLSPQQQTSVRAYFEKPRDKVVTDIPTYSGLIDMADPRNPQQMVAFANLDLTKAAVKLDTGDWERVKNLQLQVRQQLAKPEAKAPDLVTLTQTNRVSALMMPGTSGPKSHEQSQKFKGALFRTATDIARARGKPLDDDEVMEIGSRLAAESAVKGYRVYEFASSGGTQLGYDKIPRADRDQIHNALKAANGGKAPSTGEVVEAYRTAVAAGYVK